MKPVGLDPEDPLVRTAVFGQDVQDFLCSPIGDFLLKRAEQRLARLIEELKRVDPAQRMKVAGIQAEIHHVEGFEAWLGEAVQAGITAIAIIDGDIDAEDA